MKYRVNNSLIFTLLKDGSGVILRLSDTFFYSLNETGVVIWKEIENGAGTGEIVRTLCREFEVPEKEAMQDITTFLEDLRREKLIMEEEE